MTESSAQQLLLHWNEVKAAALGNSLIELVAT